MASSGVGGGGDGGGGSGGGSRSPPLSPLYNSAPPRGRRSGSALRAPGASAASRLTAMGLRGRVLPLLLVTALAALGPPPAASTLAPSARARPDDRAPSLHVEALLRLQEALGLPAPVYTGGEGGQGQREAPEFMLELQRRVADPNGVLRAPAAEGNALPHGARIVRSFFEQEPAEEHLLRFNVSRLGVSERVLGAELRIFRLRRPRVPLLLRVYQVEEGRGAGPGAAPDEHRLLGVQAATARAAPAWHSFNVLDAVRAWLAGDAPNLGLLVTAATLDGASARAPAFARRGGRAARRQPLLVLYDGENAPPASVHARAHDSPPGLPAPGNALDDEYGEDEDDAEQDYYEERSNAAGEDEENRARQRRDAPWSAGWRRRRRHGIRGGAIRSTALTGNGANITAVSPDALCSRHDLWVDFEQIGWDSWIISPSRYNAYQCVGQCPYPLGPVLQPTNHATVQSIVHHLRLQDDAAQPCCAPRSLETLSLLYTDEGNHVILKLYEDMVASSCGCH